MTYDLLTVTCCTSHSVRCVLSAACCGVRVERCLFSVVCSPSHVVCRPLDRRCQLSVACCMFSVARCMFSVARCLLFVARCVLPVAFPRRDPQAVPVDLISLHCATERSALSLGRRSTIASTVSIPTPLISFTLNLRLS